MSNEKIEVKQDYNPYAGRVGTNPIIVIIWVTWAIVLIGSITLFSSEAISGAITVAIIAVSAAAAAFVHLLVKVLLDIRDAAVKIAEHQSGDESK